MDLTEERVSSEEVYGGKLVHLFRDTARLPNGKLATREVLRLPGAVAVVPLTSEGNVILVRQYRYPFAEVMLEIPAGKLDPGEDPADCARRELSEETGMEAEELVSLGVYYPSVAVLDEKIHLYLARGLTQKESHPDEDEFLRAETLPLNELVERILRGDVPDGKTQAAVLKAWHLVRFEGHSR
ncbi:MAG: NUDIX hydrolase [Clostridiales bacterium]|nr:NUDIX hydrolase [Clostridiales bacterium]